MSAENVFRVNMHAVREMRGLTLAQLAEALAVRGFRTDQPSLSRMEKGKRGIRLNEAVAISGVLAVALPDMVDPTGRIYRAHERLEELEAAVTSARQELADQILGGQR